MTFGPYQMTSKQCDVRAHAVWLWEGKTEKLSYLPHVACLSEVCSKQYETGRQRKQESIRVGRTKYEEPRKAGGHKPTGKDPI